MALGLKSAFLFFWFYTSRDPISDPPALYFLVIQLTAESRMVVVLVVLEVVNENGN